METVDVRGDGILSSSTTSNFGYRFVGFRPDWSGPPYGEPRTITSRSRRVPDLCGAQRHR